MSSTGRSVQGEINGVPYEIETMLLVLLSALTRNFQHVTVES